MDLTDALRAISARIPSHADHLQTEEATKTALVLPFINCLGYDVFNPLEVVPEFTADVGVKQGEKVDYAIIREGEPMILFECKTYGVELATTHASQLYRYFSVTTSRIGILTNGVDYLLYSDLEAPNKMDDQPFLRFNLAKVDDRTIDALKLLTKQGFDLDAILANAVDLKYTSGVLRALQQEWASPSDEFVKHFFARVHSGSFTSGRREQFSRIVKLAINEFLNQRVNSRLQAALKQAEEREVPSAGVPATSDTAKAPEPVGVSTTDEELEAFFLIKGVVARVIDPKRIYIRDSKSYCSIILDDNNRKPLCRLWFNGSKKYLGLLAQ